VTAPPRPPGRQPERTELAWRRTGLAVATASTIAARALDPVFGTGAAVLGVSGLALAVLLLVGAARRARRRSAPGPGAGLLAAVVLACVLVGIAALVLVVAVQLRGGAFPAS
jgi:putative membrane protein